MRKTSFVGAIMRAKPFSTTSSRLILPETRGDVLSSPLETSCTTYSTSRCWYASEPMISVSVPTTLLKSISALAV